MKSLKPRPYKEAPETIGEHLRKRRLTDDLLATEVAAEIGVSPGVYRYWERDRVKPVVQFMPGVIKFLGYDPYPSPETLGEQIKAKRRELGLTQRALAVQLGISDCTITRWERGEPNSRPKVARLMQAFLKRPSSSDCLSAAIEPPDYEPVPKREGLGARVRRSRQRLDMSHVELASLLGIDSGSVRRAERGCRSIGRVAANFEAWLAQLERSPTLLLDPGL